MLGAVRVLYGPITLRSVRRIIAAAHTVGHSSAPNTHFQPSDAVLDVLYSLFAYHAGFNHGVGFVKPVLERDWPTMNFSRRAVLRAMARVNPEAARVRASGALRGAAKNGVFIAPFFGSLWQSDLNLVLQEWGLIFNSVCDVCTSTWVGLTLITDRLAATVWEDNASVVDVWGGFMPDVWTTDCGTETYVTALACRLMNATALPQSVSIDRRIVLILSARDAVAHNVTPNAAAAPATTVCWSPQAFNSNAYSSCMQKSDKRHCSSS